MKKSFLILILLVSTLLGAPVFAETVFDYEPNNSPDTAYILNGDSSLMSTLSDCNDVDFYDFNVNGTVGVEITLTSPENADYDIKLFDKNYKEIARSILPSNNTDIMSKDSLATGMYSIKVYCLNRKTSSLPYNLEVKINYISGTNKTSNAGQSEANKKNITMDNALEINNNVSLDAKISSMNESRYYKFKLYNHSDLDISMLPPKDVDLDMRLYNSSGLEVGSSTKNAGSESISKSNLLPGTYYLKVYGYNYAFSSDTYKLTVQSNINKSGKVVTKPKKTIPSASQTPTGAPRALLLYVGRGLPEFSDEDLKKLLIDDPVNTREFIITDNGLEYNTFSDPLGYPVEIVTPDMINSLTADKIDSTGNLDQIKNDYLNFYKKASSKNSLDYFAEVATDLALRLIETDSNVKLSISIPWTNFNVFAYEFVEPVKEKLLKGIKEKLDSVNPDYWKKNIRGFYYSTEGIPYYYTWFKPDKSIDYDNPQVKAMVSLSNEIHQVYGKEFFWIPYYGNTLGVDKFYNKEQFVRIGYIANRTNIFDCVFIQPSYYFNPKSENIPYIKNSCEINAVVDLNGEIIGGVKTSKTLIGPEMEIDSKYNAAPGKEDVASAYQKRYAQYANAFSNVKSNTPVAFYAGSRDELFVDAVYNAVKSFFKSIQ